MTIEKAIEIKKFAKNWITNIVAKRKDYRDKLCNAVDDLIPDEKDYDHYDILKCKDWDHGEEYFDGHCLSDRCKELIEWENIYCLTKKGQNDLICALRIAVDLLIAQSGGVVGYTVKAIFFEIGFEQQ